MDSREVANPVRGFSALEFAFVKGNDFRLHSRVTETAQHVADIREEIRKLSPKQKAELACVLIDSLDEDLNENVEQLWLDEATRRYEAYRRGEIASRPAAEVCAQARARLER